MFEPVYEGILCDRLTGDLIIDGVLFTRNALLTLTRASHDWRGPYWFHRRPTSTVGQDVLHVSTIDPLVDFDEYPRPRVGH